MVIPIFALANAGIHLSTESVSNLWSSPLSIGVIAGIGILAASVLASLVGWLILPGCDATETDRRRR